MSLTVNVAGQWTSTVQFPSGSPSGAQTLGVNRTGWTLSWTILQKTFDQSDKFGNTPIEAFHAGLRMGVAAVFEEWRAAELRFLTIPNDTFLPSGAQTFNLGVIGSQITDTAGILVLTSVANTPARTNSFTTMTLHAVSVDEDFPLDLEFGPDKLAIPFKGRVWPVDDGSGGYKFLTSA